ncbi:MAG: hypothetical protein KDC12_07410 [Flavobacteriales bacterium]|nr:hypothetical protein [Flavobacteriales bacterium]
MENLKSIHNTWPGTSRVNPLGNVLHTLMIKIVQRTFIGLLWGVLTCGALSVSGQTGYLGKTHALYIYSDITSYEPLSFAKTPWSKRLGAAFGVCVSRNLEVSFGVNYLKGGLYPSQYGIYTIRQQVLHDPTNNLTAYGGKVGFRFFRYSTGSIAPIGSYMGMEFSVDYYQARGTDYYEDNSGNLYDLELDYLKVQPWVKLGWQNIFGEHFLLGGELRLGTYPIISLLGSDPLMYRNFDRYDTPIIETILDTFSNNSSLRTFEARRNFIVPEIHMAIIF